MNDKLTTLRAQIDQIDVKILDLIADRLQLAREVGEYKKMRNIPPLDSARWEDVLKNRLAKASELALPEVSIRSIWQEFHAMSLQVEEEVT